MFKHRKEIAMCRNRTQLNDAVSYSFGRRESYLLKQHTDLGRRGNLGSGILYSVFFLMMLMIAGGIVGGTYAFFGKGYDSRLSESLFLFYQVKVCFEKNNFFEKGFIEQSDLFYEKCRINKEVLEDGEHLIYVKRVSDGKEFFEGVYDFTVRCGLGASEKNRALPLCERHEIGGYEILVGSAQISRRANT